MTFAQLSSAPREYLAGIIATATPAQRRAALMRLVRAGKISRQTYVLRRAEVVGIPEVRRG